MHPNDKNEICSPIPLLTAPPSLRSINHEEFFRGSLMLNSLFARCARLGASQYLDELMTAVSNAGGKHAIAVSILPNYLKFLVTFLDSLRRVQPDHPDVVVCQKGFTPEMTAFLVARYRRVRVIDAAGRVPVKGPAIMDRDATDVEGFYARFLVWSSLFDEYDNVLYTDVDMLALSPLTEMFEQKEFLCCPESLLGSQSQFYNPDDPELIRLLEEDGLGKFDQTPANTGVMLVPKRYRTPEQLAELGRLSQRYKKHLIWGDQSLTNLWMARNGIKPVEHFRFNYQVRLLAQRRAPEDYRGGRLLHLAGLHHMGVMEYMVLAAYVWTQWIPGGRALYPWIFRAHVSDGMLRWRKITRRLLVAFTWVFAPVFWAIKGVPRRVRTT